ncbi:hypothetical protein K438DRAFT_1840367 [Mycena galopus ATCC 62051]|nr:hypothetical protein K438DRAFT_1840367 [Mycena galopus ATCC 62051]
MRSTFAPLLILASSVGVAVAQTALEIFTPQPPEQCTPTLITWQGGSPPYIVVVVDSANPTPPIMQWTGLTNTSITWTDTPAAGTSLLFTIVDSTGLHENSAPLVVGPGGSDSCLSTSSSSSSGSSSGSAKSSGSTSASSKASASSSASTTASVSVFQSSAPPPLSTPTSVAPTSTKPTSSAPTSVSASASGSAPSSSPTSAAASQGVPAVAFIAALGAVFAFLL